MKPCRQLRGQGLEQLELEDFLAGADFDEEEAMEAWPPGILRPRLPFGDVLSLSPRVEVANQTGGE